MTNEELVKELRSRQRRLHHAIDNNAVLNVKSLAGDLAILYGLVADMAEQDDLLDVVRESLEPADG